ncbi:hypothetical protein JCM8547_007890 [Rhodosporidiobolus lusitaniae]
MNKLKQVFSNDEHKSPSGHFTTESSDEAHRDHSQNHYSSTDRSSSGTDSTSVPRYGTSGTSESTDRSSLPPTGVPSASHSTGTTGATSTDSTTHKHGIAGAAEHLREHAHPPAHQHNQPTADKVLSEADAKLATHDHQHLAPVTHETRYHHEIEEVERQREVDRHVHHVQHHVQPVLDTQHAAEVHREKVVPVTEVRESHVATDEDKAQFASLNTSKDTVVDAGKERVIIDKGESVVENTSHHVHHVVQPVIERDTHEHQRIHTVIPVHQTTHEAPIVHSSVQHEPMSLADFTAGGGDLSSKLKHDANLLIHRDNKDCERVVEGPAETLTQQLGLTSLNDKTSTGIPSTTGTSSAAGTTGAMGTTGAGHPSATPTASV